MNHEEHDVEVKTVQCSVCMAEVPRDEAESPEGRDYVVFLCGLDCYQKWKQQADSAGE
jgi:hypothetical protein